MSRLHFGEVCAANLIRIAQVTVFLITCHFQTTPRFRTALSAKHIIMISAISLRAETAEARNEVGVLSVAVANPFLHSSLNPFRVGCHRNIFF